MGTVDVYHIFVDIKHIPCTCKYYRLLLRPGTPGLNSITSITSA